MLHRLLAVIGFPAHVTERFVNYLLGLAGIRLPVVLLLIGMLWMLAGWELARNYQALATRPEPRQATVTEIVEETERRQIIWLSFTADVVAEPFVREIGLTDSVIHAGGRRLYFYYLALDPDDRRVGLIVRSTLDDDHFRVRRLRARLVEDPQLIEAAAQGLDLPDGLELDRARYLDETGDAPQAEAPLDFEQLVDAQAGTEIAVVGRVPAPSRTVACAPPDEEPGCEPGDPDARWVYLLADPEGDAALLLRSPHPPDAIPVGLSGLVLTDTFGTTPVVDSDWLAEVRRDLRYPRARVLVHGAAPPFRPPNWVGPIVMGGAGLALLVSFLVGYPIFRRTRAAPGGARLAPGEQLAVELHGRLESWRGRSELEGTLGFVERMTLPDLVVTLWRYGQAQPGEVRRDIEARVAREAGSRDTRLVVHAPGRSLLAALGDGPARLEPGTVYRVTNARPALRLEDAHLDLMLVFDEQPDRDRAAMEISRESSGR